MNEKIIGFLFDSRSNMIINIIINKDLVDVKELPQGLQVFVLKLGKIISSIVSIRGFKSKLILKQIRFSF